MVLSLPEWPVTARESENAIIIKIMVYNLFIKL